MFFSSDFTPFSLFPSKPAIKRLISLLPWKEVFPVFLFFPSRFHTVVSELIFPGVQFHFSSDLSFLTDCVLCPQSDKPTRSSGNDRLERNWKIFNCQIPTRGILNGQIFWSCWKQFLFTKEEKLAQQFLFDGSRNKSCFYISEQNFEFLLRSCVAVDAVPGRN